METNKSQVGFRVSGEYLTEQLRSFWVELEHRKILEISESIPELSLTLIRAICSGLQKIVDSKTECGALELEDDNTEEHYGISISIGAIRELYNKTLYNLYDSFLAYSQGSSYGDKEDVERYLDLSLKTSEQINKLKEEFQAFVKICKDSCYSNDSKFFKLDEKFIRDKVHQDKELFQKEEYYHFRRKQYLSQLDFNPVHAIKRLVDEKKTTVIQIIQLDHSNGLRNLEEHREAQETMHSLREGIIQSEDILKSIWNSGWLAPDGRFFGCPDLIHNMFSKDLYERNKELELNLTGEFDYAHGDKIFEDNKWVKFSSGRWIYTGQMPVEEEKWRPTKKQYDVILSWAKERSDGTRIVFGHDDSYVNLDIIESQRNSLK